MICYLDMTFCINPNCTCGPHRKYTEEIQAAAELWWNGPDAPIAIADVCGDK